MKKYLLFPALMSIVFISCKDESDPVSVIEVSQKQLLVNGNPAGGPFTFYSFETGAVVPNSDSATNKWDFGIRFATIIVNSNASGPGNAEVQLLNGVFDNYREAPATGYAYDTSATKLAVKSDWYNYDPVTRTFSPKAGKIFVFKTATGKYAKLEMLTADPTDDNGNPVVPPTRPTKIKYGFRTGFQRDGSRNL
jgi:hypothetical protein